MIGYSMEVGDQANSTNTAVASITGTTFGSPAIKCKGTFSSTATITQNAGTTSTLKVQTFSDGPRSTEQVGPESGALTRKVSSELGRWEFLSFQRSDLRGHLASAPRPRLRLLR